MEKSGNKNKPYTLKSGDLMVIDVNNRLLSFAKQANTLNRECLYFEDGDDKMLIPVRDISLNSLVFFIIKLLGFNKAINENTIVNKYIFILK